MCKMCDEAVSREYEAIIIDGCPETRLRVGDHHMKTHSLVRCLEKESNEDEYADEDDQTAQLIKQVSTLTQRVSDLTDKVHRFEGLLEGLKGTGTP